LSAVRKDRASPGGHAVLSGQMPVLRGRDDPAGIRRGRPHELRAKRPRETDTCRIEETRGEHEVSDEWVQAPRPWPMSRPLLLEARAEARFGRGPCRAERCEFLFSFLLSIARFAHGLRLRARTPAGIRRSETPMGQAGGSTGGCTPMHRLRRLSRCVPSERHFPVGDCSRGLHKMRRVWSLCGPLSCRRHFPGRRDGGRHDRLRRAFSQRGKGAGREIGGLCGGAGGLKRPAGEAPATRPLRMERIHQHSEKGLYEQRQD
jgi:hypothetical protein